MKGRFFNILILFVTTLVSTSCIFDKEEKLTASNSAANREITVNFTIATGEDYGRATRAGNTWENNNNENDKNNGDVYENKIDVGTIQVLAYSNDGSNTFIGKVEPASYVKENTTTYSFSGKLTLKDQNMESDQFSVKLVVLANCNMYNPQTGENLSALQDALTFNYTPGDYKSTPVKNIPMWGIKTIASRQLTPNMSENIGTIYMLRAMAKVKVLLENTTVNKDMKLFSVSLNKYHSTGNHTAPASQKDNTEEIVTEDESFNPSTETTSTEDLPFTQADDGSWYIYLPEYDNANDDAIIKIRSGKTENSAGDFTLKLQNYTNGEPNGEKVNIIRNHIYQYKISSVQQPKIDFSVLPWNLVTSETGWDIDRYVSVYAGGGDTLDATIGDYEARFCLVNKPRYAFDNEGAGGEQHQQLTKLDSSSVANYIINVTKPAGAVWVAELSDNDKFGFSYKTYGDGRHYVSTGIARKEPYMISVYAKNRWTVGDSFTELTEFGKEAENKENQGGTSTQLRIKVSLDGSHFYYVKFNKTKAVDATKTYYKDRRRFAGGDDYIQIWQRKAVKGAGTGQASVIADFEEMARGKLLNGRWSNPWWKENP